MRSEAMRRLDGNCSVWAILICLALVASRPQESRAGTIPAGTYTTAPGFVNTKSVTVTALATASGTGDFVTTAPTDISFTVATQASGNTTTYSFSETITNDKKSSETWTDFEMSLGGNVGATFTGTPFSNKLPTSSFNKASNELTFSGGVVDIGTTVTFSFLIVLPNPKPNTAGVLILTEQATVPEPSSWIMAGTAVVMLAGAWRRRAKSGPR
jgi:PEP-CTERM motif